MPRAYALSLIFTSLTLIGGLFYGQYWYLTDGQEETLMRYEEVNELLLVQQSDALNALRKGMQQRLADDSRAKFRPVLSVFEMADKGEQHLTDVFNQSIDSPSNVNIQVLRDNTMESILSVVKAWTDDLDDSYKVYDLHESNLKERIKKYDKLVTSAQNKIYGYRSNSIKFERNLLMLIYLSTIQEILFDISSMSNSCRMIVDQFFPILINQFARLEPGQNSMIRVGIGSYASSLNPKDVKLMVNGTHLKIGYDGIGEYLLTSTSKNKQQIKLECEITTPLTDETQRGSSIYWYNQ
jgi:hypothetical protein